MRMSEMFPKLSGEPKLKVAEEYRWNRGLAAEASELPAEIAAVHERLFFGPNGPVDSPDAVVELLELHAKTKDMNVFGPVLIPQKREIAAYSPDERPDLYLSLASIDPSPAGILRFACENGTLGLRLRDTEIHGLERYDNFYEWLIHVSHSRRLLQLWSLIQQEDDDELNRHFTCKTSKSTSSGTVWRWTYHPRDSMGKSFLRRFPVTAVSETQFDEYGKEPDDYNIFEIAKIHIRSVVNTYMSRCPSSHLNVSMQLITSSSRLVDVAWCQLAKAISDGCQFNECVQCGKLFEVAGGAARADRMYCSVACKLKVYRARIKEAKRLRAEGKTLRQISKATGSDMETVKSWTQDVPKGG